MSNIIEIKSQEIATGDCVVLPRVGKRTVQKITALNEMSVRAIFDDGKKRRFNYNQSVKIDPAERKTLAVDKFSMLRYDRATGRTSVVPGYLDDINFFDIAGAFYVLPMRVSSTREAVLMETLRRGSKFYTNAAIYWLPQESIDHLALLHEAAVFLMNDSDLAA